MQGSLPGGTDAVDKIPVARIVEALENPVAHINITVWTDISGYSFYLVGGWCQLYSSSGYQSPDPCGKTGAGGDLRMLLDGCGETRGYRSACDNLFERNDLTMTGDYSNQHLVPMKQWCRHAMKRVMILMFCRLE